MQGEGQVAPCSNSDPLKRGFRVSSCSIASRARASLHGPAQCRARARQPDRNGRAGPYHGLRRSCGGMHGPPEAMGARAVCLHRRRMVGALGALGRPGQPIGPDRHDQTRVARLLVKARRRCAAPFSPGKTAEKCLRSRCARGGAAACGRLGTATPDHTRVGRIAAGNRPSPSRPFGHAHARPYQGESPRGKA